MKKTLLCLFTFVLLFGVFQRLFTVPADPRNDAVWRDLQQPDSTSDLLFMGNSQAYTSLDADMLSDALNLDVRILATNAQSMEMSAANLKTLLRTHHPRHILLEASSAITPAHDHLQGAAVSMVYANTDGIRDPLQRGRNAAAVLKPLQLPAAMLPLLRPLSASRRIENARVNLRSEPVMLQSQRGTELRMTYASAPQADYISSKIADQQQLRDRYAAVNPAQGIDAYNHDALIDFCRSAAQAGLEVWIYKTPYLLWDENYELGWQTVLELASEQPNVQVLTDGCLYLSEAGLLPADFYDGEHLNRDGARKFTRYFGDLLAARLNIRPEWSSADTHETDELQPNQCILP